MKKRKIFAYSFVALIAIGISLYITGLGGRLLMSGINAIAGPPGNFDPTNVVAPAPDYSLIENWAAHPETSDPADLSPEGVAVPVQGDLPVDVFFVHPTGYLTPISWISPMDLDSGTEENIDWVMANQASAFNGCCNIYAPRYRQANIFAYFGSEEERESILSFAYQDVKRAFEHYLNNYNNGKPFVLASHSQGTHHSMHLLSDIIDNSDLHERMVAAYLIGAVNIPLSPEWFAEMENIEPCNNASDLGCVIHWDTMPDGGSILERPAPSVCTNPLTWSLGEEAASIEQHAGIVIPQHSYNLFFSGSEDTAQGKIFDSLAAPILGLTGAQCRDGTLFVERLKDPTFGESGFAGASYHLFDYNVFYMNIHENARFRSETFLSAQ
jgi:hypothetical protein